MTISLCLLKDNLILDSQDGTLLKKIVDAYLNEMLQDPQGLYERLCELNGWAEPSENENECCRDYNSETYPIVLKDRTVAGLLVCRNEGRVSLQVYAPSEEERSGWGVWEETLVKEDMLKRIHDESESVIMEAKKLVIRRIAELLEKHFDGVLRFAPDARLRLDKYDMELDMTIPIVYRPSGLMVEGGKPKDGPSENVVFSYVEIDGEQQCDALNDEPRPLYRWTDNLKDMSFDDILAVLYKVESELAKRDSL